MAQMGISAVDPEVSMAEKSVENMPPDMAIQKLLSMNNPKLAGLIIKNRMLKQAAQQNTPPAPQGTVAEHIDSQVQQHAVNQARQGGVASMPVSPSMYGQGMKGGGIVAFAQGGASDEDEPQGAGYDVASLDQPASGGPAPAPWSGLNKVTNFLTGMGQYIYPSPAASAAAASQGPPAPSSTPPDTTPDATPKGIATPSPYTPSDYLAARTHDAISTQMSPQDAENMKYFRDYAMRGPQSMADIRDEMKKNAEALGIPQKSIDAQNRLNEFDSKLESNKDYGAHLAKIQGWAGALKQASLRGGDAGYAGNGLGAFAAAAGAGVGDYAKNMQGVHNQYMQGQEKLVTARNALTIADMTEDRAMARDAVMLYKSGVQDHVGAMRDLATMTQADMHSRTAAAAQLRAAQLQKPPSNFQTALYEDLRRQGRSAEEAGDIAGRAGTGYQSAGEATHRANIKEFAEDPEVISAQRTINGDPNKIDPATRTRAAAFLRMRAKLHGIPEDQAGITNMGKLPGVE